jgi:hypothetical protein
MSKLSAIGLNMGTDNNFIKTAIALPYKFGYKVEEIFVGTGGSKPHNYPVYEIEPDRHDEELWNRHLGKPTPPELDKEKSKEIIMSIIMTFLKSQPDITKEIDISFDNALIKDIWGEEVVEEGKKEKLIKINKAAVDEFRKVLHTVVDKRRRELKGYEDNKNEYSGNEKDTFDMLVKLYKVVSKTEIKAEMVSDKGGKMKATVMIGYPKIKPAEKRILEEKIGTWICNRCLKINNGYKYCEECGIDVRINKKEGNRFLEQEEILMAQILQQKTD